MRRYLFLVVLLVATAAVGVAAPAARGADVGPVRPHCDQNNPTCAEVVGVPGYEGQYVGHDEPAVLFYSDKPGSGNTSTYTLRIPTEPPTMPTQDRKGGTYNFQTAVTFWFGMALCDNQSGPEYTHAPCQPNTDANIFEGADPRATDYVGKHPGAAFLEVQFYPPGYAPQPDAYSCDAVKWCAAVNIWSVNYDYNHSIANNADCLERVGIEPGNFAYVTKNGVPANGIDPFHITFDVDQSRVLMLNPGDLVTVDIHDTADGVFTGLRDRSTGQSGSMVASKANGFKQVVFDPKASTCTEKPYAFHPMYATSSERTRVPWGAHSYNVSFSSEIGHFEYCNSTSGGGGDCTKGGGEPLDPDDNYCFKASESLVARVTGCFGTDTDFDGTSYQRVWPGTDPNPSIDARFHASPVVFSSPLFAGNQNYDRVAFEADLPWLERSEAGGPCNISTGAGCVNPPPGADFYPIFSTRSDAGVCSWQIGGTAIQGTDRTFGATSTAEFGQKLAMLYPGPLSDQAPGPHPSYRYTVFRRILPTNPCRSAL